MPLATNMSFFDTFTDEETKETKADQSSIILLQ